MKRGLAAVILALSMVPLWGQDTTAICKKVAERYRSLPGYTLGGEYDLVAHTTAGVATGGAAKFQIFAAVPSNKLRIEYSDDELQATIVSDGATTWTSLPKKKVYTRVEAVTENGDEEGSSQGEELNAMAIYQNLIPRLMHFDQLAARLQIVGEQEVKTGEGKVRCWILMRHIGTQTEKYWVDQERFLVWRIEATVGGSQGVARVVTLTIKRFTPQVPEDAKFTFEPKPKDQLVDALPLPNVAPSLVGKPALDFALKSTDGTETRLSDLHGKIVVLDFWATWCPPCRRELPTIEKLSTKLKDQNVVFLGVNDEGSGVVKSFCKKQKYTFTTLEDGKRTVSKAYHATAIPNVYVINPDGVVVQHFVGVREEADLVAALKTAGLQ